MRTLACCPCRRFASEATPLGKRPNNRQSGILEHFNNDMRRLNNSGKLCGMGAAVPLPWRTIRSDAALHAAAGSSEHRLACSPGLISLQFPASCGRPARSTQMRRLDFQAERVRAGRRWHAFELRLKSFEDLQRIWIECVKEQNLLHTCFAWNTAKRRDDPAADQRPPGHDKHHNMRKVRLQVQACRGQCCPPAKVAAGAGGSSPRSAMHVVLLHIWP
jgi:Mitochondrial 39-S ribosomal protein L47 (MRP-L47)